MINGGGLMWVIEVYYIDGYKELYGPFESADAAREWEPTQGWKVGVASKSFRPLNVV